MKLSSLALIITMMCQTVQAELLLPPDITAGIKLSRTGESGGLFVHGVERQKLYEYVCAHWREIAADIESLPESEGDFVGRDSAFNSSVQTFGTVCEELPGAEYLDFLDKFLELYEHGRIGYGPLQNQLMVMEKKECFLDVNWEHPRVKAILSKARSLIPPDDENTLAYVDAIARGELADSYQDNRSENFYPETLPGIRLKRPWERLIKQYEKLTGKKYPYDSDFDPRPVRHSEVESSTSDSAYSKKADSRRWPWILGWITALTAGIGFLRLRWKRSKDELS